MRRTRELLPALTGFFLPPVGLVVGPLGIKRGLAERRNDLTFLYGVICVWAFIVVGVWVGLSLGGSNSTSFSPPPQAKPLHLKGQHTQFAQPFAASPVK